ncbi:hypothetical protein CVT25_001545 [Psilocybe cyanescens]|uniref:General transcription and DNA repair factor IIH subunit TFB5 n=1 Tax=Psilocybe cyanescens TaxID=93625 RepID=A0A409WPR7_PSICY|nr:hypothetical protein CVT25_001545 [Psilocybe cyanescens]
MTLNSFLYTSLTLEETQAATTAKSGSTSSFPSDEGNQSDPAVKQILLLMNERESFIIEDLDDNHLVIKAEQEYRVRKELESEFALTSASQLEKNTYSLET